MNAKLPVIVGFGGFNAAGRSSGHQGYRRMVIDSLAESFQQSTLSSLASMMGLPQTYNRDAVLNGTLVRKIESAHFDAERAILSRKFVLESSESKAASFTLSRRQLPTTIPENWKLLPLDEDGKQFHVTLTDNQAIKLDTYEPIAVKSAGQLPSGFEPSEYYRSLHHPRGLQMAVLGASDAIRSMGIPWSRVSQLMSPDHVSVYSASLMSQLDINGFGGLFGGRNNGGRATSKQLALGLNSMPADFINAYVLGSMGATGAIAGACATFLYNLRQGVEDIRSGRRLVSVVGASEAPIIPEIIDGYAAMGALAGDDDLKKLDGTDNPDYRRASRPFGKNCGFILSESSQYVVLMADELALELGAKIYGAVPSVYVNADGYKKSISAPGAGNYLTMAKAVGLARNLLGDESVQQRSIVQAHGSSTPQNRVTESKIFDAMARTFGIEKWPVLAVKAYLGHSLAAASGDQLAATLGIFEHGILPGIKTHSSIAEDVFANHLNIPTADIDVGDKQTDIAFLNSKGFGGNNATATVFAPHIVEEYLSRKMGGAEFASYQARLEQTNVSINDYEVLANKGDFRPIYDFGKNLIDEDEISLSPESIKIPGFDHPVSLEHREGFGDF